MKNIWIQALIILATFFASYLFVRQINWMKLFHIEQVSRETEAKFGKLIFDYIQTIETVIEDPEIQQPIDSMLVRICESNHIDSKSIHLHIVKNDEVNAFALPGQHLVIHTALITDVESPEELSGIIAHELAHIQLEHVMQKMIKEIGLAVVISIVTGDNGAGGINQALKILSSTAFDREFEKEADLQAVKYLVNAQIDPKPFASFLEKLSKSEEDIPKQFYWFSTHPQSKERAQYILESCPKDGQYNPVLTSERWNQLKSDCQTY